MVSSGRVIRMRPSFASPSGLAALLLAVVTLSFAGCAPSIELGRPPPTDRLDQLKLGVSTASEVKSILGEPQGRGAVRSPSFGVKNAWLYESMKSEAGRSKMRMLMVFMDSESGVYQGHMWFSSGMLFGQLK